MEYYDAEGNLIEVKERKNSIWTKLGGGSLMFAAIFHLLLLIIGAFWIFQVIGAPEEDPKIIVPGGESGERSAEHQRQQKKLTQVTPVANVKRAFAHDAQSNFYIPEQSDDFGQITTLTPLGGGGNAGGLGNAGIGRGLRGVGDRDGIGNDPSHIKLFQLPPEKMRKRCSKEDRLQRLKENGGTPACEDAVVKALRWLKNTQNSDGSWGDGNRVAMTGFALLAYFGHCETPSSDEFGESCMRGIVYLVDLASKNEGRMASNFTGNGWCYEHAIGTYALGEASTFCKEGTPNEVPQLMEVTAKAGQFIIDNQNKNGGWAYQYATEGGHTDVSVVGWQLQALKACDHAGFRLDRMKVAVNQGLEYLNKCQNENGGFGYAGTTTEAAYFTLTGVGMLCNQVWEKGARVEVRKAAKYLIENSKFEYNSEFADLYGHYYESQAMMQRGGADWKFYNDMFRDQVLNNQNEDGSFKVPGGGKKLRAVAPQYTGAGKDGSTYRTCLCTLMLEVYYRFLSTGGGDRPGTRPGI